MDFKIIDIFNRSVTIELENESVFTADKPYRILLDGELYGEQCRNVATVSGLEPHTSYELTVVSEKGEVSKSFTTQWESVLLNVRRFGAVGDGAASDTAAIQAAICACPEQGTVHLPRGIYRTGPVFLKSHMTLWLEEGAVLLGETDYRAYPILPGMLQQTDEKGEYNLTSWEGNPLDTFASLITGIRLENVDIIGPGTLDGNAQNSDWWNNVKEKRVAWRPKTVFFCSL